MDLSQYSIPKGVTITLVKPDRRTTVEKHSAGLMFFGDDKITDGLWTEIVPEGSIGFRLSDGWSEHSGGALLVKESELIVS